MGIEEYVAAGRAAFCLRLSFTVLADGGERSGVRNFITGQSATRPDIATYSAVYEVRVASHDGHPSVVGESLSCKQLGKDKAIHELVSWSLEDGGTTAADTASVQDEGFYGYALSALAPLGTWVSLLALNSDASKRVEAARYRTFEEGRSLLFSREFETVLNSLAHLGPDGLSKAGLNALQRVGLPLRAIVVDSRVFATKEMAVLPTSHQGVLALSFLPLASHGGSRGEYADNMLLLDIERPVEVPLDIAEDLDKSLAALSRVIGTVVPGLQVRSLHLGRLAGNNGEQLERMELLSVRDGVEVPLRNESEGVKKILSIIAMLVDVHTNPATFVAIDELDSGVFEYLLGEILSTISKHGMGQLVFTAHNLRPLEVLPSKSIYFSTTDPDRRYVQSKGVRGSNNLRRMYLRDIRLGGDGGQMYRRTSDLEIDEALYEAGQAVLGAVEVAGKGAGAHVTA